MDKIAVLDFGSQYAHLITDRIRRLGVYAEIRPSWIPAEKLVSYRGLILSGGPASVYAKNAPKCDKKIFSLGMPILGICYGHHLIMHELGGMVESGQRGEYGKAELQILKKEGIFREFDTNKTTVWMSHGDVVTKLPEGFESVGKTHDCQVAAYANPDRNIYGVQFHPEVAHTPKGKDMLNNFLDICGTKRSWNMDKYMDFILHSIEKEAEGKKVFMLVSGGVDSTVAFSLLNKALGPERVYGLLVDTGFMRLNEAIQVEKSLKDAGFANLHVYDASQDFLRSLIRIYHPERKRQIIGEKFLAVQKKVCYQLGMNSREWLLGQGTIYPDTIESATASQNADKIKTHHNRIPQISALIAQGKVIEPLKNLYKDEVRELGEKIGLPEELVWRHPFPGPGLAVRCLSAQYEQYPLRHLELEREINVCLGDTELRGKILPVHSVGVQGDARTYKNPLVLCGDTDWETLERISTRLTNQFREINRVLFAIIPNIVESIEVFPRFVGPKRIFTLQQADKIVMDIVEEKELMREIWQFPVVLVPLGVNGSKGESIVLRPVLSEEAMTAQFARIDWMTVHRMAKELLEIEEIGAVFYDVTHKPPATIEWE